MIYLLRHGESVSNREGRLQGQSDSPLTLEGIEQIRAIGRRLRDELGDPARFSVVSSPLGRARQSAAIVCQTLGLDPRDINQDPRLAEISFGAWDGLTIEQLKAVAPGAWAQRQADRWNFVVPGGESYALLAKRVGPWLAAQSPRAELIVVCHGAVSRVLRGLYAGLPERETVRLTQCQRNLYRLSEGRVETLKVRGDDAGGPP